MVVEFKRPRKLKNLRVRLKIMSSTRKLSIMRKFLNDKSVIAKRKLYHNQCRR